MQFCLVRTNPFGTDASPDHLIKIIHALERACLNDNGSAVREELIAEAFLERREFFAEVSPVSEGANPVEKPRNSFFELRFDKALHFILPRIGVQISRAKVGSCSMGVSYCIYSKK